MMSGFIYLEMINEIRSVCSNHVAGLVSAAEVQRVIQRGEMTIVAVEESDIQRFLTDIEGQLELVKFTVDDDRQFRETQKIASHVLTWLAEREVNGVIR